MLDENFISEKYESRQLNKRLLAIALVLSMLIATGVFWGLKLTGITMAGDALCGIEEHSHTEECYENVLVCEMEENNEHQHSDVCYEQNAVCGKEEHIHTAICYSDTTADVETESIWKGSFIDIELTDNLRNNLLEIAFSQLGYKESSKNFDVDESGSRLGYTRYGAWYDEPYSQWSSLFVSFCMNYAGIGSDAAPYASSPATMLEEWNKKSLCLSLSEDNVYFGDILFLDLNEDNQCDAVAIVSGTAYPEKISVFQGDVNDSVSEEVYSWNDERILCFGSLQKAIQDELLYPDNGIQPQATTDTASVYGVNSSSGIWTGPFTRIAYGGTVAQKLGSSTLIGWTAVVIEYDAEKGLYVSQIDSSSDNKGSYKASTANGFVLMYYRADTNSAAMPTGISVGDYVSASPTDFYKTNGYSSSSALGTLTFTSTPVNTYDGTKKPDKDNSSKLSIIDAADTMNLIEVNLYDYGLNCNDLWKSDSKYPGFQQGGGTTSPASLSRWSLNFGDNITSEIFAGAASVTNQGGDINKLSDVNGGSRPISGAIADELINGYPALSDGTSLAYLFSDNTYATKQNKNNINGLFQYDPKSSSYYYDCRENHAQFNSENDTFTLYEQTITPNFMMYPFGNFMPLNDIVKESTETTLIDRAYFNTISQSALYKYSAEKKPEQYSTLNKVLDRYISEMDSAYKTTSWNYQNSIQKYFQLADLPVPENMDFVNNLYNIDYDEESDFFFGMDMHLNFIQPKNGLTGEDGTYPMVFDFTGDDDVWIFVDGKLFLDLSGIHRHVGGIIDFQNGEVRYYDFDPETSETDILVKTETFAEILGSSKGLNEKGAFSDYTTHSFDFYYMERGSGSGICKMEFNLPTLHKNTISVAKELSSDVDLSEVLGNPDFYFQVYKEGGEELLIGSGVEYDIYSTTTNQKIGTGVTGADGVFTVKAEQRAVFSDISENAGKYFVRELLDRSIFEQYGTVNVDGSSTTLDHYTNVTVGEDSFKGIDSAVKDIADGSTYFSFDNDVDSFKYGGLEISKILNEYSANGVDREFTFYVELDDTPIPVGAAYKIIHSDNSEEMLKVTQSGVISLKHGERIVFNNILAGSKFSIKETGLSPDEYSIIYNGKNTSLDCSTDENGLLYASGIVESSTIMRVEVVNDKNGTKIGIPVTKSIANPDGIPYNFSFELNELVSAADMSIKPNGVHLVDDITLSEGSSSFIFTINYPSDTPDGKHYYKITEIVDDALIRDVDFDESYYIAEVTTVLVDGTVKAELTGLWKNGLVDTVTGIAFENSIMRSLSISKTVVGNIKGESAFRFDITAMLDGSPVNGVFKCFGTSDDEVRIVNGHATVYVGNGETLTIIGLPIGMEWSVEEVTHSGYYTSCGIDGGEQSEGNALSGKLDASVTAEFTNFSGNVLPATGSNSMLLYTLGGIAICLVPLVYRCILGRKRERRADSF